MDTKNTVLTFTRCLYASWQEGQRLAVLAYNTLQGERAAADTQRAPVARGWDVVDKDDFSDDVSDVEVRQDDDAFISDCEAEPEPQPEPEPDQDDAQGGDSSGFVDVLEDHGVIACGDDLSDAGPLPSQVESSSRSHGAHNDQSGSGSSSCSNSAGQEGTPSHHVACRSAAPPASAPAADSLPRRASCGTQTLPQQPSDSGATRPAGRPPYARRRRGTTGPGESRAANSGSPG